MKFLCDRCKTRYSIGDDRVRGKILKIRCKNCANVITVREGMTDSEPAVASQASGAADPGAAQRREKKTTLAPAAQVATPAAAPVSAQANGGTAKPPPALEEEWYVSIDGEQAGPYSLFEAQRWVGARPASADLHCWSEGFDDWLPVDKVSHFRGLRKPAPASVVRPLPRPAPVEDEPKPLFAATMASLEKGAALAAERALALPLPATKPEVAVAGLKPYASPRATPPLGHTPLAAKTNGAALPAPRPAAITAKPAGRVGTVPGFGTPVDPEPATQIEVPPFRDEPAKRPVLADLEPEPHNIEANEPDDGFDIGEVSRVVKLADIAKMGMQQRKERTAPVRRAASLGGGVGRGTMSGAAIPLSNGTASNAAIQAGLAPFGDPSLAAEPVPELAPLAPPPQTNRLYIVLLAVSLLLLGAVGVVVYVVTQSSDDGTSSGLVKTSDYDTTRPDDPTHRNGTVENGGSATPNPFVPHPPPIHRVPLPHENGSGSAKDDPSSSLVLKAEEVETEAAKHSLGTQRCYMRSQKGEQAIIVGDVKKISVTLAIDKEGSVVNVSLSDHGADSLGTCLINQVKSWKFRENNGGTFKITMVFQGA